MIQGLLIVCFFFGGEVLGEESACYAPNRFEYEHKVLEKLISLEQFKADVTEKMLYLEQSKDDATVKLLHLKQSNVDAAVKLLQLEQSKAIERIDSVERQLQGTTTQAPHTTQSSSTYVHWGMKTCPNVTDTTLIYSGQAGGGRYDHPGSGEYVCLPNDPSYDQYNTDLDNARSWMYGAEYETYDVPIPPIFSTLANFDVPCAVCLARRKTSLMIPGRTSCYAGWTKEYQGYLMAEYYNYQGKGYVCMDKLAEGFDSLSGNENGALFHATEGRCGALRCPPYINGAELACVVCSTS
ncbi:short-chain collagen C4-like [Dreissena polymorpha]|uniref:Short-chain collagen C4 n=1 Tax=Dreissena polymorpha TaxID=45954 RepID=A0A9D4E8L2_DREPO|nr:short-chain collagen C4-like [Dreissena polymorpha]KAH3773687.1 hypothetical protein DPMN_175055 [Dreissena polymorpha]